MRRFMATPSEFVDGVLDAVEDEYQDHPDLDRILDSADRELNDPPRIVWRPTEYVLSEGPLLGEPLDFDPITGIDCSHHRGKRTRAPGDRGPNDFYGVAKYPSRFHLRAKPRS